MTCELLLWSDLIRIFTHSLFQSFVALAPLARLIPSIVRSRFVHSLLRFAQTLVHSMPYTSEAQLRVCYSQKLLAEAKGQKWTWDCDEWLAKTPKCIPPLKGYPTRCKIVKTGEKSKSRLHEGARGGLYFYRGGIKIYVPGAARTYALKKFGKPIKETNGSKAKTMTKKKVKPKGSPKKKAPKAKSGTKKPAKGKGKAKPKTKRKTKKVI